jgi:hypothetical protein
MLIRAQCPDDGQRPGHADQSGGAIHRFRALFDLHHSRVFRLVGPLGSQPIQQAWAAR